MSPCTHTTTRYISAFQQFHLSFYKSTFVMAEEYSVFHVRVLFHYVLALLWPLWIISTIFVLLEEYPHGRVYTAISTAIYTAVLFFWLFMDYLTLKHKIYGMWALVEILTMLALGITNLAFLKYGPYTDPTYFTDESLTPNAFENAFLIFHIALYLAATVSLTCLASILFSLWIIVRKNGWHKFFADVPDTEKPLDKSSKPRDSFMPFLVDSLLGPSRGGTGEEGIRKDFWTFADRRTPFRKHIFEYRWLSIVRGTLALYAVVGLALYLAELSYHTFLAGAVISVSTYYTAPVKGFKNVTIVATQLQSSESPVYFENSIGTYPTGLTASVFSADGTNLSCQSWDTSLSSTFEAKNQMLLNCNYDLSQDNISLITQLKIVYEGYPSNTSANDVFSSLAIWIVSSPTSQTLQHRISEIKTQILTLNAYKLVPKFHGSALVSLGVLMYGNDKWASYKIEHAFETAPSNETSSSLILRLDPSQKLYLKQKFSSGPVLDIFLILGSLGGVFTIVSGMFAVVFGRDLLIIITGGWSLSPLGVLGLLKIMRNGFRRRINEEYPQLKKEIHSGGMAQFLTEVAIDVHLIDEEDKQEYTERPGQNSESSASRTSAV